MPLGNRSYILGSAVAAAVFPGAKKRSRWQPIAKYTVNKGLGLLTLLVYAIGVVYLIITSFLLYVSPCWVDECSRIRYSPHLDHRHHHIPIDPVQCWCTGLGSDLYRENNT
jgi:hypothetical protein